MEGLHNSLSARVDYIDILKALAIILVVAGHAGAPLSTIIYMFHMPLFFFVSGYLYKDDYSKNPIKLLKKRIRSLYIPFVKYEIIFLLLHPLFYKLGIYNNNIAINGVNNLYFLKDYLINSLKILSFNGTELLLAPFWFLTALFITTIIFSIISYIIGKYFSSNEFLRLFTIITIFSLGFYLTNHGINLKFGLYGKEVINVSFVALFIFYIGYLYKRIEKYFKFNYLAAFSCFMFLFLNGRYDHGFDMRVNLYPSPAFLLISSVTGIYFMIYISKKIVDFQVYLKFFKYLGKNTIPIMALHMLSFKLISLLQLKLYNLPLDLLGNFGVIHTKPVWWLLYTLTGVLIPIITMYIFNTFIRYIVKAYRKVSLGIGLKV